MPPLQSPYRRPRIPPLPPLGLLLLLLLLLGGGGLAGCGSGSREGGSGQVAADQEWLWLSRHKQELDQKREELAADGSPQGPQAPDTAKLAREVEARTAELDRRLIDFINAHPPVQGEPLTHRQQAAIRMKSEEDLSLAREHAEKGGDYQRAAEICEAALAIDPDNPALKEELERIRAARFMTADRFSQARKGMTPAEVREALGGPNPHNVRAYPDRGIEAWFYPKDETGAAAGVWFEKKQREEDTRVYQLDFDAIRPGAPAAAPAPKPAAPPS
jgi:outer membrane protein assembly factor BamE (lipoprotein component of BamABCDE complex)